MSISTTLKHIERCMLYMYVDFFRNHHRNIDVPAKNKLFVGPHTYVVFCMLIVSGTTTGT